MYLFFLEIGSIALAVAAVIFLVLYIVEWIQRNKDQSKFQDKMKDIIFDYEHRLVAVEEAVALEKEWTEQFIMHHPKLGEEAKQILLDDLKAGKHRAKLPYEITPQQ